VLTFLHLRGSFPLYRGQHSPRTIRRQPQSDKIGLGLDIARDSATQEALKTALVEFVDIEVDKLAGKQLSADDFHALVAPEPDRMILQWLNDPPATKEQWGKSRWKTFRSICKKQYDFDPETDGEIMGKGLAPRAGRPDAGPVTLPVLDETFAAFPPELA
jgi:hypothetical protein